MAKRFSLREIEHLASLCRLSLDEKEKEKMARDLSQILDFVEELKSLDVEKEEPFLFEDQVNSFREDGKAQDTEPERYLTLAPERLRQFFKVPRILK